MAKGKKRLTIRNLVPGEKYAVQVRAVDGDGASTWSQKYHFTAIDDSMGGTRKPKTPVATFFVDDSGQYQGSWNSITTNTDDSFTVIARYDVELKDAQTTAIVSHVVQSGTTQTRTFNFAQIRSLFNGTIPASLTMRVRAINSAGTVSDWSAPVVASLPAPEPPRNVVATGVVDAISIKWDAPVSTANLFGYRVYLGFTAGFVPTKQNMIYQGSETQTSYTTLTYGTVHHFKVVSYSEAGIESTSVSTSATPASPYGPDSVAPLKPVLGTPTIDRTDMRNPKANVAWTINESAPENQDLAGFVIRWRLATETNWRTSYFDKSARAGIIALPHPFANYTFEISAYDFTANYSDFSGTAKTLSAAATAPAQVTGVDSIARFDGMRIKWTESTSDSVKYGGKYEVQFKTSNSFPNNTPDYITANNEIDMAGLNSAGTYYVRVRAVDSAGQAGPWSAVHSKQLPDLAIPESSDGLAPATAPMSVTASPGLNYINVSWKTVSNNDEVIYEVYMGTSAGVTATPANLVGTSGGTSLVVNSLSRNTTYYFKVRATDADGAGPLSAEANAQLTKVSYPDLGIDLPGENLYINSSFDEDSDSNGVANYWAIYNYPTDAGVTSSLTTGRAGGNAQRVSWSAAVTNNRGVYSSGASVLKPHTEYTLSFYARATEGTGFKLVFNNQPVPGSMVWLLNPTPSATEWKRYAVKFTTTATPEIANAYIAIDGAATAAGWLEIDDAQIEAGNMPSAYKSGTVSISKLTTGRFTTADMIIATGGRIVSETHLSNPNNGFSITDAGITIKQGQIDAKTLVADSTFTSNLNVGSKFTIATSGTIESANYDAGPTSPAGFRLSHNGLDIRSGFIAASTLGAGVITSPDIKIGVGGKLTIDSTGTIQSNNYSATTGWRISSTGIEMNDVNSTISASALKTGTIGATTVTIGSGGSLRSSTWAGGTGARWLLSETNFTMYEGAIQGTSIITNQLQSASTVSVTIGGVTSTVPAFSLNATGHAQLVGAQITGNAVVGTGPANALQSGNYQLGVQGWKIAGSGEAEFSHIISRSDGVNGPSTSIQNYANVYEGQNWNLIAMSPGVKPGWTPWNEGLIWAGHIAQGTPGAPTANLGYLRISSPRVGSAAPSFLNLQYDAKAGLSKAIIEADVFNSSAKSYEFGVGGDNRLTMTPNNTTITGKYINFGNTGTPDQPLVFRLLDEGAGPTDNARVWSLRSSNGRRFDVQFNRDFGTRLRVGRDPDGTLDRMEIYGSHINMIIGDSTGNLTFGSADNMSGRPMIANHNHNSGIVFAGTLASPVIRFTGSTPGDSENNITYIPVRASQFNANSDMRQKSNVQEVDCAGMSEKFEDLTGYDYQYEYVKDDPAPVQRGLSAQEVSEIMPELVNTDDDSSHGLLSVDIYALATNVALAVGQLSKANRELAAQVQALQDRLDSETS